MSNTDTGQSPAELEEKLATYRQLVDERETLEARIARAKEERENVSERVFRKVLVGYEEALEAVKRRIGPIEKELDELRRHVAGELKALDAVVEELEDELAEVRFRHRVGEFSDEALAEAESRLHPQVSEARRQRDQLARQLAAMDRRRKDPDVAVRDEESRAAPDPSSQSNATAPAAEDTYALDASSLMNEAPASDVEEDPLAALSDPDPRVEYAPRPERSPVQPERLSNAQTSAAVSPSYPSLMIRSGAHEGKIVPLLPMTMTIGREHDNSVELKDENVARYHARVMYEDGRFVIEDLQSSSGTWVNGARCDRAALSVGDVIRIGETELAMEFA
jgi:predicted component of type VI protein secretion system